MKHTVLTRERSGANPMPMTARAIPVLLALGAGLGGCVQVQAPDKPIEINLNVNIRQEVIVSLKKDASDLITENPELFPQ